MQWVALWLNEYAYVMLRRPEMDVLCMKSLLLTCNFVLGGTSGSALVKPKERGELVDGYVELYFFFFSSFLNPERPLTRRFLSLSCNCIGRSP
jgi:hypothetical protein